VVVGRLAGLLVPPLGGDVGLREVGDHVSHVGSFGSRCPGKRNPATAPVNRGTSARCEVRRHPGRSRRSAALVRLPAGLADLLLGASPGVLGLPQDALTVGVLAGSLVEGLVVVRTLVVRGVAHRGSFRSRTPPAFPGSGATNRPWPPRRARRGRSPRRSCRRGGRRCPGPRASPARAGARDHPPSAPRPPSRRPRPGRASSGPSRRTSGRPAPARPWWSRRGRARPCRTP